MEMTTTPMQGNPIECCGVRCTERELTEVEGGRVMVRVGRDDVQRVRLRHGIQAPHPLLQVGMGLALTALNSRPRLSNT